jgi:hypothetical protein
MSNELHGRTFNCTTSRLVPPYAGLLNGSFVCAVRGSIQNQPFVSGDAYMRTSYNYYYSHLWRNLGILFAFTVGFIGMYLIFFSYNIHTPVATASLSFRRGHAPKGDVTQINHAGEKLKELNLIHTKMLSWRSVCYDVPVGDHHTKRLLQDVSGWVKPGELTALMVSLLKSATLVHPKNASWYRFWFSYYDAGCEHVNLATNDILLGQFENKPLIIACIGRLRGRKDHSTRCTRPKTFPGCREWRVPLGRQAPSQ